MTKQSFYRRVILGVTDGEENGTTPNAHEHEEVLDALEWSDTDSAKELAGRAEDVEREVPA